MQIYTFDNVIKKIPKFLKKSPKKTWIERCFTLYAFCAILRFPIFYKYTKIRKNIKLDVSYFPVSKCNYIITSVLTSTSV